MRHEEEGDTVVFVKILEQGSLHGWRLGQGLPWVRPPDESGLRDERDDATRCCSPPLAGERVAAVTHSERVSMASANARSWRQRLDAVGCATLSAFKSGEGCSK